METTDPTTVGDIDMASASHTAAVSGVVGTLRPRRSTVKNPCPTLLMLNRNVIPAYSECYGRAHREEPPWRAMHDSPARRSQQLPQPGHRMPPIGWVAEAEIEGDGHDDDGDRAEAFSHRVLARLERVASRHRSEDRQPAARRRDERDANALGQIW